MTILRPPFEAYRGNEPFIFASYAHRNADAVYPELIFLKEQGFNIWYDEGIDPGNEWPDEIASALERCQCFLVFISPESVDSHNVRNEINFALDRRVGFLAVHLTETAIPSGMKLQMGSIQAILKYINAESGYQKKLIRSLEDLLNVNPSERRHFNPITDSLPQKEISKKSPKSLYIAAALALFILGFFILPSDQDKSTPDQKTAEQFPTQEEISKLSSSNSEEKKGDEIIQNTTPPKQLPAKPEAVTQIETNNKPNLNLVENQIYKSLETGKMQTQKTESGESSKKLSSPSLSTTQIQPTPKAKQVTINETPTTTIKKAQAIQITKPKLIKVEKYSESINKINTESVNKINTDANYSLPPIVEKATMIPYSNEFWDMSHLGKSSNQLIQRYSPIQRMWKILDMSHLGTLPNNTPKRYVVSERLEVTLDFSEHGSLQSDQPLRFDNVDRLEEVLDLSQHGVADNENISRPDNVNRLKEIYDFKTNGRLPNEKVDRPDGIQRIKDIVDFSTVGSLADKEPILYDPVPRLDL